ncbi:hypothetical protein [Kingella denitrificans]|uniref:hypothetical protein n=1 Tax=Kingella denitrificans TaxID=502 RepID=UPI00164C6AFD|nr:hypothetical protein [Kingella denitrificans]
MAAQRHVNRENTAHKWQKAACTRETKVQAAFGTLDVFPKQPAFFARRRSGAAA